MQLLTVLRWSSGRGCGGLLLVAAASPDVFEAICLPVPVRLEAQSDHFHVPLRLLTLTLLDLLLVLAHLPDLRTQILQFTDHLLYRGPLLHSLLTHRDRAIPVLDLSDDHNVLHLAVLLGGAGRLSSSRVLFLVLVVRFPACATL